MIKHFKVSLDVPVGVTTTEVKEYIMNSVASWKGQLHPENPLINLDPESVKCSSLKDVKKAKQTADV